MGRTKAKSITELPKYFVLLSVEHRKCGRRIETAEPSLTTRRAIAGLVRRFIDSGELRLPDVYCTACRTYLRPTHFLIGEVLPFRVRAVVSHTEIATFDPSRWPDLPR